MPEKKPYQWLAWTATTGLIISALLASFVPQLFLHHYFAITSNFIWAVTAYLWREFSLVVLNTSLTIVYLIGYIYNL